MTFLQNRHEECKKSKGPSAPSTQAPQELAIIVESVLKAREDERVKKGEQAKKKEEQRKKDDAEKKDREEWEADKKAMREFGNQMTSPAAGIFSYETEFRKKRKA